MKSSSTSFLKPQTQLFSILHYSPLTLSPPSFPSSNPTQTQRKPISLSLSVSLNSFSPSNQRSQPQPQNHSYPQHSEDPEEEEHVVGDCVVFEDGIFEDPFLQNDFESNGNNPIKKKSKASMEFEPENLVPDKWKEVQAEINITKKEKKIIAQQIEFGSRLEKKNRMVPPMNTKEYLSYKEFKLAHLKPVVLDNPTFSSKNDNEDEDEEGEDEEGRGELGCSSSGRVVPRNPRLAVYRGTLDGISEFFNSGDYEPGENAGAKSEGPRKLFTKEEKVLLNKRIPNLPDATSGKWLPLHTLAASGEFYLVDALLKHNVDINAADKDGLTALHKAILCKKQAVANYLLRESANPLVRDKEGATLMHYAVQIASLPTIKILLLYNVEINLADDDGWTPLHLAVQTRRTDVVRLLLIKGADKTLRNKDGLTPLDMCLYSGRDTKTYELIKILKHLPKIQHPPL